MAIKTQELSLIVLVLLILFGIPIISASQINNQLTKESFEDVNNVLLLAKTKDKEEIVSIIDELEKKWFQKDKTDYANFISLFASKCNQNADMSYKDNLMYHELSDKYTKMALDKLYNLKEDQTVPAQLEINLTMQINKEILGSLSKNIYQEKDWPIKRCEAAKYYFCAWEKLEKEIDPNWNPLPNSNVFPGPPAGYKDAFIYGMSPDGIKDPKYRTEYQAAINKYNEVSKYNNEQSHLRRMKKDGFDFLVLQRQIIHLYSGPEFICKNLEIDALKADITKYVKDEKIVSIILEDIKNRHTEDLKPRQQGIDMQPGLGQKQNEIVPPGFDNENSIHIIDNGQY